MKALNALFILCSIAPVAHAADIVVTDPAVRKSYLQRAEVWLAPNWISSDFKFAPTFDMAAGPKRGKGEEALGESEVFCNHTEDDVDLGKTGLTPKFTCRLASKETSEKKDSEENSKKPKKVKVKYGVENPEIYGELMSTRLLWALGFGADKMYFVEKTHCFGCTADPYKKPEIDPTTLENPRVFTNTALEVKFKGDAIRFQNPPEDEQAVSPYPKAHTAPPVAHRKYPEDGWAFPELMKNTDPDRDIRHQQRVEREALRLLSIMLQHIDNKPANQRLICVDNKATDGTCDGRVVAILQDVGSTFGKGLRFRKHLIFIELSKVELKDWAKKKIWSNSEACVANMGLTGQFPAMFHPSIAEEGRVFLANLLAGFTEGEEGKERVRALFAASHVDRYNGSVDKWVDAFMSKVEQIRYPMGAQNPDFKCPSHIK